MASYYQNLKCVLMYIDVYNSGVLCTQNLVILHVQCQQRVPPLWEGRWTCFMSIAAPVWHIWLDMWLRGNTVEQILIHCQVPRYFVHEWEQRLPNMEHDTNSGVMRSIISRQNEITTQKFALKFLLKDHDHFHGWTCSPILSSKIPHCLQEAFSLHAQSGGRIS